MNIQLLPKDLHAKLFPNTSTSKPKKKIIQLAQQHLQSWDIPLNKPVTLPEVCFDLPSLEGDNIAEHFYNIGLAFENQYTSLLHRYLRMNFTSLIPSDFVFQKGWTKYSKNSPPKSVSFPDEDVLTFDIEVLYKVSKYPVMATALGENGFYAWISPWLIDPLNETSEHLISLGNRPLLVIGHNVSFDRQAILEEYALKQTKTLFLDTMSLHCATHGMSTQQIDRYKEAKKDQNHRDGWFQYASLSSLSDLSQYYLSQVLDKESRNYFEQHDIQIIQDKYQTLLEYCAKDTLTTYRVLKKLYPEYTGKCPHPVSFISMLMMGSSYLPVTNSWNTFIQECEKKVQEWTQKIESALYQLAIKALETYIDTSKGREVLDQPLQSSFPLTKYATESLIIKNRELSLNPWLSQLDWTLKPLRLTKKGKAMANQVLPNYPQWFVNLWDSKLKKIVISPRKEVAPLLLQLKWREFPLFYSKSFKWGYLVPPNGKADVGHIEIKLNDCNTIIDSGGNLNKELFLELIKQGYTFFRLPHKDGNSYNSGTPFSKFHLTYFEQDILHSENLVAKEVVLQQVQCAYWVVTSDRIKSQFVVWQSKFPSIPFIEPFISAEDENSNEKKERKLPEFVTTHHPIVKELPMDTKTASNQIQLNKKDFGVILPMVVVMGTLTRRAVEPTWMTASNSKKTRIGSDLKRYVVAPPGYAIVGADVDAEELWILSILGDACFGIHGSTAVSWRNLQGQKSD
ncbi:DNA-directed DNA polymerase gamma mip1, partial [Coelomomyces lativittatus]